MHVPDLGAVPRNAVPQAAAPIIEQTIVGMFHLGIADTGGGGADLNFVLPTGKCYTFKCAPETVASLRLGLARAGMPVAPDTIGEDPAAGEN